MPAFFLAFLAAALATLGGREALRAARLGAALGPAAGLVVAIVLAAAASSALAAWLGMELAAQLAPSAKRMFAAFALLLAALEVWLLRAGRQPREPTRSFPAILLVLLVAQALDGARLLVLAIALATGGGWLAAAGGALGSAAIMLLACRAGRQWENRLPLRALRHCVAGSLLLAALVVGLNARGIFG